MPIKSWTIEAETISYSNQITFVVDEVNLFLEIRRSYSLLDIDGKVVKDGYFSTTYDFVDVPTDIKTALTLVNNYSKDKILEQEGIVLP